ncbi:MAG: hypothetical protein EAZ24_13515 [Burkholderiales bacterium]|nr:MAG: hypothetical protein EAZ24_13515 [Burkholderiales bacterium]
MRRFVRWLLLIVAVVLVVAITLPAFHGLKTSATVNSPTLLVQSALLLAIAIVAGAGIVLSALSPTFLAESGILKNSTVCAAYALPGVDLYAHITGNLGAAIGGHMLTSFVVGSALALAIASAWIEWFRRAR